MKHPIDKNMEDKLSAAVESACRNGADAAKIHFGSSDSADCTFESGRLKNTETRLSSSYSIVVVKNGKLGSASGNDTSDLDDMINRALVLADCGSTAHFHRYPEPRTVAEIRRYDPDVDALEMQRLVDVGGELVELLKRNSTDLFIEAGANRRSAESILITSGGVRHVQRATRWSLQAEVQRTEGTDMLFSYFGRGWRALNEHFAAPPIAERILQDIEWGTEVVDAPEGQVPVFVDPDRLRMLLMPVMMGVNGRNVARGDSPLQGRIGEQVLSSDLTVRDEPHVSFAPGAAEIDSDGVPTRRLTLFDRGVLKTFLYDLDSAGLAGTEPTGNDGCAPHNLEIDAGKRSSDAILGDIQDGLYIKILIGFGQGNIINGDFSANVGLGFRIRDGRIVGRVKNTMIAGNVYEMLADGLELSSDRDPLTKAPYAVLQGARISSR